ncbi:hypothetical protein ACF1HU_07885 [Streptomyces olivaceus]
MIAKLRQLPHSVELSPVGKLWATQATRTSLPLSNDSVPTASS